MSFSFDSSIALGTFATVILAIASNRVHLSVAAMLGTVVLLLTGVLSAQEASETINPAEAMISLFFGGMVTARTLIATGLFDYLGASALRFVRGDGRRLMITIVAFAAPICAFLPNATVVILLAPLIVSLCQRMKVDFIQPVILLVFVANSSGLLTLVGDPATFIVGNSIGLSFSDYLSLLSSGGLLAIVAVVTLLPFSFRSLWRVRVAEVEKLVPPPIKRPWVLVACLGVAITNLIVGTFDPVTFISSFANVGQATTQGVEAFAAGIVNPRLRLRADYTYTEARDDTTGLALLRRPVNKASLSAIWSPIDNMTVTTTFLYVSPWVDVDRSTFVRIVQPGYELARVAAEYRLPIIGPCSAASRICSMCNTRIRRAFFVPASASMAKSASISAHCPGRDRQS